MPHDVVRVRRDWIDVRHEYLQVDGRWIAGACAKPGFCRECNRDGERAPMTFIAKAWVPGVDQGVAARVIIAAHLYIPVKLADDDATLRATAFRRLSIAHDLHRLTGADIDDAAALDAKTIGDLMCLISEQAEA